MNAMLLIFALLVMIGALVLLRRAMFPRGAIDLRAPVSNADHKFGEAKDYFRADVISTTGSVHGALFTDAQVREALLRALRNPEDL